MKSPFDFVVEPKGSRYNNTKKVGDKDLIVNTEIFNHQFVNREAIVKSIPTAFKTDIKPGDTIIVHHNVFKYYNDMKGRRKSGKSFLRDNIFFLDPDQFFAYKKGDKWYGYDRYCFIKSIPPIDSYIFKPLSREPLMGEMVILNEGLKEKGVKVGDRVCYKPHQDYEFVVDEQVLYRMYDHSIVAVL